MKKLLTRRRVVALLILGFVVFVYIPAQMRVLPGKGSRKYARRWREQLLACVSLDEVKQRFNCWTFERADGGYTYMQASDMVKGRTSALVKAFPDGRWLACAYADSHFAPGGGTVVTRDSDGVTRVFFGHVCGGIIILVLQRNKGSRKLRRPADDPMETTFLLGGHRYGRQYDYEAQAGIDAFPQAIRSPLWPGDQSTLPRPVRRGAVERSAT
jgi:hypothetical protein